MNVNREQILPILFSIVVVDPAIFLGGLVNKLVSRGFNVGFWGTLALGFAPSMLAAALISYRWPDKFWRIAPIMTATLLVFSVAEKWGERKGALWYAGIYVLCFTVIPYFVASVIGYWLRMRADSRSET